MKTHLRTPMLRAGMSLLPWILGAAALANAQQPVMDPRDSVKIVLEGKKISIDYGRPSVRGRRIFGDVVPYFRVWRTGAGAATILRTDADLEMDGAIVPRGAYSIYTLPSEKGWKFIINKQTGQWGTVYNSQLDLARIDVAPKALRAPVEEMRFRLEQTGGGEGMLRLEWEKTSIAIPFHVSRDVILPSPKDSVEVMIGGARIAVTYGRPSRRGRAIVAGVVPYGKVWRTGANEATAFTTTKDLIAGGVTIPKGSYTLYSLPSRTRWLLIVNKQTGQWGTVYDKRRDLARIPMKRKSHTSMVEKFSIALEPTGPASGRLLLRWETTQLSLDFKVKR